MIRRRLLIRGRVQGVGFRVSCADRARTRGVAGWARNRSDGSVEVVLEGAPEAVASVVAWCREGPRLAEVAAVEVVDEQPDGTTGFAIR